MEGDHATGMVYIQRLDKPGKAPIYCVEPDEEFNNSLTGYTNFDDISQFQTLIILLKNNGKHKTICIFWIWLW